jgi:hypothetical protein
MLWAHFDRAVGPIYLACFWSFWTNNGVFLELIPQLVEQPKMTGVVVFAHQTLIPSQSSFSCHE